MSARPFDALASLREARRVLDLFANAETAERLDLIIDACADALRRGETLLACGNGGSMADAMHFCEELTGRFRDDRPAYAAIALSDPTHLTCVANDYGFERVFARGVEAFGRPGGVLVAISTSGSSANVLAAAREAKSRGMTVAAFTSERPSPLAEMADHHIAAPGRTTDRIQELHMLALHIIVEGIEARLSEATPESGAPATDR